jgi:hypothetical protein
MWKSLWKTINKKGKGKSIWFCYASIFSFIQDKNAMKQNPLIFSCLIVAYDLGVSYSSFTAFITNQQFFNTTERIYNNLFFFFKKLKKYAIYLNKFKHKMYLTKEIKKNVKTSTFKKSLFKILNKTMDNWCNHHIFKL